MADGRYKTVSTFALPDEYQRQASEARRRRRMAEMLAQQAYQPGDIQNAPIPRGAPLVQGLQAFLAARAARKADEAEEGAMETQTREARQFLKALTDEDTVMDARQPAMPMGAPTVTAPEFEDGRIKTPAQIDFAAPPPMEAPQVQLSRYGNITPGQRRALALEGVLTSQNPLVQKIGQMQYGAMQPKQPEIGAVSPADFTPESLAEYQRTGNFGVLKMRDQPDKPPTTSGGMQWDATQKRFVAIPGYEEQQGRIAAARRPDVVIKPTDERLVRGQQFSNENTLRDEYTAQTANFRVITDAYKKIMTTADTGAGDMSLLYQYVKLLDPGSVVRESEFATAAASGSFGDQIQGAAQQIATGKRLTPELKAQFRNEAQNIFDQQQSSANQTAEQYRRLATDYGLDPTRVVPGSAKSYATEAEADAAFKSGKLKKGDRIVVNGVSGVWE
jgi:hypothetical protein